MGRAEVASDEIGVVVDDVDLLSELHAVSANVAAAKMTGQRVRLNLVIWNPSTRCSDGGRIGGLDLSGQVGCSQNCSFHP